MSDSDLPLRQNELPIWIFIFPGPLAIIRRFSSKFGFRQSQNTEQPTQSENAEASKDNRKSSDDQKHVTIIRVKTVQNKDNKAAIEDVCEFIYPFI